MSDLSRSPEYSPPRRDAAWLSSEDVKAAIMRLAEAGADKAFCWDMMSEVHRLVDQAHGRTRVSNGIR